MLYPVTEHFTSLQGEGFWAGTPMHFVRLSHCPVGKTKGICTNWDGKQFVCDTGPSYKHPFAAEWHNYEEVNDKVDANAIWSWIGSCKHLCLTGGEPMVYDLLQIINKIPEGVRLHIETSGTIQPFGFYNTGNVWVTVSPKRDWKESVAYIADEFKWLVDSATETKLIREASAMFKSAVHFVQPIEDENWHANTERAMQLAIECNVRLSIQLHKQLGVR